MALCKFKNQLHQKFSARPRITGITGVQWISRSLCVHNAHVRSVFKKIGPSPARIPARHSTKIRGVATSWRWQRDDRRKNETVTATFIYTYRCASARLHVFYGMFEKFWNTRSVKVERNEKVMYSFPKTAIIVKLWNCWITEENVRTNERVGNGKPNSVSMCENRRDLIRKEKMADIF